MSHTWWAAWRRRLGLAVVLVLTPVGPFWCPRVACLTAPEGLQGYFRDGRLLITAEHRPWALLSCRLVVDERDRAPFWRCPAEED
jgi:hypothetical protein